MIHRFARAVRQLGLSGALVGCAWLCICSLAAAEPARVHLVVERPVGTMCPSERVLASDVEQLSGRTMFGAREDADVLVRGQIIDAPDGVVARLEARTADGALLGSRELRAAVGQCASLRRSLALVLTLLLDEDASREHRSVRRPLPVHVGAGAGVLTNTLPRASAGFSFSLGFDASPGLRVRTDTSYWLPVAIETTRGVGAQLQALGSELSVCPRLSNARAPVDFWLCAGAQLGALLSTPRRLTGPPRQARWLGQATAGLRASVRLGGRTALEASLGLALALSRPRFSYENAAGFGVPVHRPSALGAILRLSLIIEGR
jgi:hypothetical protein